MPSWQKRKKRCTKCGKLKRYYFDFYKAKNGKPRPPCKKCWLAQTIAWQKANPEKHRAIYRQANHRVNLRIRFGITPAEFDALFSSCGNLCGICNNPETRNRRLSLDHDHRTKRLRGFLCSKCNIMLGLIGDDPERLEKAANYLRTARLEVPKLKTA